MSDVDSGLRRDMESLSGGLIGALWGLKVTGLERIPRSGPLIIACNHASLVDPPVLACGVASVRRPWFLAKKELFATSFGEWFFSAGGGIPLERGRGDTGAMRAALEKLSGGGCLAIFPEGTRVAPGEKRAPKTGVSFLSARGRAPVLPARVVGSDRFPFAFPLELRVGTPLPPPDDGREAAGPFAQAVMNAIYSL